MQFVVALYLLAGQHHAGVHQDPEQQLLLQGLRDLDDAVLQCWKRLERLEVAPRDRAHNPGDGIACQAGQPMGAFRRRRAGLFSGHRQRLALMMAVMMLGMPQVYSCHTSAGARVLWDETVSEARVCPPVALGGEVGTTVVGDQPDPGDWKKLSAVHCQATQSVLTFMCSLDGRSRKVKFEKF
jgi:hypothetical protein